MDNKSRKSVQSFYELGWEKDRLSTGMGHAQAIEGKIEKTRTLELLNRYINKPNLNIIDVGGAAGAYSFMLASLGHRVHLIDLVPLHIEQAKEEQKKSGSPQLASCTIGDACDLKFPDNFADIILLMGPLYHLQDKNDRQKSLQEAFRVLKAGGILFAIGISRFVSLLDILRIGIFAEPGVAAMIEKDLQSGCHDNPAKDPRFFTTAYFHKPEELASEIQNSGFINTKLIAIEGPILFTNNLEENWKDEKSRNLLLQFARQVESESAIMGMSNHIAAIGYKP